MRICTMSQEEAAGNNRIFGRRQDAPVSQTFGAETGSYAHQDLVTMMRRRREAEGKLRQRQEEAAAANQKMGPVS
jgi:hypothetical protein